ncbi:hypothetical protein FRC19_004601 [Serendipita sp. 401]|nr:hypothetical protein FRC19_004601 [Serendipita sp. 401]KAG9041027.1 hypothetical protein FS842_002751 [Serendipita sp. 407]
MATRLILRASSSRISVRVSLQSNTRQALWFPSQARFITTKKFTPEHEYISYDSSSKIGVMSITDYAQKSLGDVVFVELPVVGTSIGKGDLIGAVESVKAASDIYAPVSGKVVEVNEKLNSEPGLLNKDPEGEGWLCKIEASQPEEMDKLLDAQAYQKVCEEGDH